VSAGRRPTVLIFGESDNDRRAIARLVEALCPNVTARPVSKPQVLVKGAVEATAATNAQRIADLVRAASERAQVVCVFAHQDADNVEPNHSPIAADIEAALVSAGVPCHVHAVVPAWELESWWFLFPAEVASVRAAWTNPATQTPPGLIRDAKESLRKALRPNRLTAQQRKRFPDYRESDSITIAEALARGGRLRAVAGTSASYDRFVASVDACCAASA
jgi:hypothetical protein